MAGLRKPKKKSDSANPSTVLVIFTIFFGLLSVGMGGWTYSVFSQQEALEKKLADAKKALEPSKEQKEFYEYWSMELLTPYGINPEDHKADLGDTSVAFWKLSQNDAGAQSRFGKEKSHEKFKGFVKSTRDELDKLRAQGYKADSCVSVIAELQAKLRAAEASYQTALEDKQRIETTYKGYKDNQEPMWAKMLDSINQGVALALQESRKKSAEHLESLRKVQELNMVMREAELQTANELAKKDAQIKVLEVELERSKENVPAPVVQNAPKDLRVPHALMLDVSKGKSLWDSPVGKITRINTQEQEVYVNVGSALGVKPQTTFNVFAPGWKGQEASGRLKGTIEIIRVVDANSSLARVTSLYDAKGQEIALNDPAMGRVRREVDSPLKEGDLLFNLVFGLRVAIAGNINWEGASLSENPAEQMRTLQSFIRTLKQQGVIVDAYLDVTEGRLVGQIQPNTKLLITGALLRNPDGMDEHAKKVNDAIATIRAQAIEQGMFQISADNLAFVTGYRRVRSANDHSLSVFRPSIPAARGS